MVENGARRETCARCKRPLCVCYCSYLPQKRVKTTQTHVLVLQHQHENRRRAAISSVPVLAQTLENVTLVTLNGTCDCGPGVNEELDSFLYNGDKKFDAAMILFPDEHAQTLEVTDVKAEETAQGQHVLLIVIDGTWKQAKKIAHRNKSHWEEAARNWKKRGASLRYVCLEAKKNKSGQKAPATSIYGNLRREPMDGCLSTLEAVASALMILEPQETGHVVHDLLLHAFQGMVSLQTSFHQQGQITKLQLYDDISKAQAVEKKRLEQQLPKTNCHGAKDTWGFIRRQYVFYTTHMDFRHRQQLVQHGDVVVCTYNEAKAHCLELNHERKRGQRVAMLPLEAFTKHLAQCHDEFRSTLP